MFKIFLNNLYNCSVSQIHNYIIQQLAGGNMAMIIRFQLGNPCIRNKGTLFSAQIFPTYHQTPIMCYRKPLSLRHSPHTHFRLYRLGYTWFWSFNYVLSQRILVRTFLQHQLSFRLYCLWWNLVQTVHQTKLSVLRNWHFIAMHSICMGKPWFCLFLCVL